MRGGARKLSGLCPIPNYAWLGGCQPAATRHAQADLCAVHAEPPTPLVCTITAQKLAKLIADTPHMMGSKMHYGGLLVIKVAQIKDEATAKPVKEALGKVKGVERVLAYPAQHSVEVQFATKGDVTTKQLIEALKTAGLSATT